MARKLHKITDDSANPTTTDFLPLRVISFFQRLLTDDPQDVIGDHSEFKYKFVAVKLSGWQPFNIHICLDLAVILLTLSMSVVEIYDLPV